MCWRFVFATCLLACAAAPSSRSVTSLGVTWLLWLGAQDYNIPIDEKEGVGPLAKRCWRTLLDIQTGVLDHPWAVKLD